MPVVKMPNGDLVQLPDNPTPQQLQGLAAVRQKQAQPESFTDTLKEIGSSAWDWTKNIGTAAYKGAADLAAGAGDAFAGGYDASDAIAASMGVKPRELHPGAVSAALNATGYQPKTEAQAKGQNIARAVFGAAFNPENGLAAAGASTARQAAVQVAKQAAKAGVVGAGAGAGSEVAGQVTDNPLARIAGGMLGGMGTGVAQGVLQGRNTASLASKALADVKPEDLDTAKQNMILAQLQGVPVNLSQAMPQASNIDSIVETLANNSHGKNITNQLRAQPGNVSMGLEGQLLGLPGDVHPSMQEPANMVNNAATAVVQDAKDQRTQAFQDTLADAQRDQHDAANAKVVEALQAAKEAASRLQTAKQQTAAFQAQVDRSASAQHTRALAQWEQEAKAAQAANDEAQQVYQTQLQHFQNDTLPKSLPPVGSEGVDSTGRLLSQSEVGDRTGNAILVNNAMNDMRAGQGQIVLPDGRNASEALKPQPPQPPKLQPIPEQPQLVKQAVPSDVHRLDESWRGARADYRDAKANADSVGSVPQSAVQSLYGKLTNTAAQFPNTGLAKMITDMRDKLFKPGTQEFITDADQLNNIFKETNTQLKAPDLATKGLDAGSTNYMRGVIGQSRDHLGEAFEPLKAANAAYADATENIVNPTKQSVTGRLATAAGAKPDIEASTAKLQSLFDKGTNPGAQKSEILQLAKDLSTVKDEAGNATGSMAYQDAVKTWFANKLSKVQAPIDGRTPPTIAQRFVAMFGNGVQPTPQSQGLRDMLAGVAKTQGVAPSTYVKGMENFSKVIGMAAKRPNFVQGANEAALDAAASSNPLSVNNRVRTGVIGNLAARWNESVRADAYREMDRLLTSPEGVDMLKKLAAGSPLDPKMQALVNTYLGTQADVHADNYGQ